MEVKVPSGNDIIFDLEQSIMHCWSVVDDIKTVYHSEDLYNDQDKMMNVLLGLSTLYQLKFEECFKLFEQVTKEYWELKNKCM